LFDTVSIVHNSWRRRTSMAVAKLLSCFKCNVDATFPFYENNDGIFMCICDKHDNFVLAKTK
jgi:hypothetical protein